MTGETQKTVMFDGETVEQSEMTDIAAQMFGATPEHLALWQRHQELGNEIGLADIVACVSMPLPLGPPPKPAKRSTRH